MKAEFSRMSALTSLHRGGAAVCMAHVQSLRTDLVSVPEGWTRLERANGDLLFLSNVRVYATFPCLVYIL